MQATRTARPTRARGRAAAELALVGVAAGWGLTFTMVQDAIRTLSPLAFIGWRFLAAALLLGVPVAGGQRRLGRSGWRAGALLGVVLCAGYALQTFGLAHTTASNAGFITGLYVVFTPLLARVLLGSHLSGWVWGCVALATVGLGLLSGIGGAWRPLGDGLMLACAVAFAVHILTTDWAVRGHAVGPLVAVQLGVCGVLALLAAAATGQLAAPRGGQVWFALLFTAVFASALAYVAQSFAQTRTSPARTSLILATEPAFAGLFGFWLAGDRLGPLSWLGAAILVAAILLMEARPLLTRGLRAGGAARRDRTPPAADG